MKNWKYIEGAKTGNIAADITTDGNTWFVTTSDGKKKEFPSEREAEAYVKKIKTGNEDKTGAEEFFKKLSDDVKEREEKDDADIEKVGNSKEWDVKDSDVIEYIYGDPNATKLQRICEKNLGTYDTSKVQALLVDEKSNKWAVVKRGTSAKMKVGNREIYVNQSEQTKAVVYEDGTIMLWDKNGNNYKTIKAGSLEEARKKLNSDYKKVGNKTYKVKESSGHDGGYDYGYIVVDESNRSVGRTFSTRSEAEEYIRDLYKKEKVGNATPNYRYKDFLITNPEGHEYIVFLKDGRTVGYRGTTSKAQAEDWCDWHDPKTGKSIGNKVGNEASDDKFAYVMREFDEGKLKTPDGKVVTDPAQAKAIAYSESKKTENGLARARKAMNAWNSERKIEPVGKYREFIRDLKNAIMLDVAAVTYNNVDEQTLKSWVEQAKKEGFGSAIKGVQGKKVILDVY